MEIEVIGIPIQKQCVRVKCKEDIGHIAELVNRPVLHIKNAQAYDPRYPGAKIPMTKVHSVDAVIIDNVMYEYIYDIKEDEP